MRGNILKFLRVPAALLAWTIALSAAVDFRKEVQPVLEANCVQCHGPTSNDGGLSLHSKAALDAAVKRGFLKPGNAAGSRIYEVMMLPSDDPEAMPPDGPQVPKAQIDAIGRWLAEGAPWPEGVTLSVPVRKKTDDLTLTRTLHKRIASKPAPAKMDKYAVKIASDVSFDMVPIPAGEFTMGTPDSEKGRRPDEGPQHRVKIEPFWMAAHEVTWDEYRLFMFAKDPEEASIDAVSRPTRPYVEMSFGMGINGYPAISMTQHAANKYAQWLSAKTGQFYRLPTEAEWEYACRAGSQTAYFFGDDPARLGDFAWFEGNSNGKYEKVATKKPNPWGLYDILGNVMEWTLDQYVPDFYAKRGTLAWAQQNTPYPQVVRGGAWSEGAENCRCGIRVASEPAWKMQDPQLPKSIWYLTDAQWVGFRVVRPLKTPTAEEMHRYWNNGVEVE